ncbi:MAG: hypothetical protein KF686_01410 [Ramlibacter sp.]|nr:hypothetical protein [Ramlibacter sp.]
MNSLSHRFGLLALATCLAACSGIPLSTVPRLLTLQSELLQADPSQFVLAIQTDERMVPPAGATPTLNIALRPREAGGFEPWERKLPMAVAANAAPPGLPRAGSGRHWLVYSLGPSSQRELVQLRERMSALQAQGKGRPGGSLGIGISQEGIAVDDPRLARTRWDSWLQTSAQGGFFPLWSGTLEELRAQARGSTR